MEPVGSHGLSAQRHCDVLMVSDFRFPGGTSRSAAEEIAAQAQVGWATGLVHLNGPLVSRVTAVNPRIREQIRRRRARLLVGDRPIRTKVVVVRHPAVLRAGDRRRRLRGGRAPSGSAGDRASGRGATVRHLAASRRWGAPGAAAPARQGVGFDGVAGITPAVASHGQPA